MKINEAYEAYRSSPSETAMETLYPLVKAKVESVIGRIFHEENEELAVTITGDVLMTLNRFNGKARFSTWVDSVARRMCHDEMGARYKAPEFLDELSVKERNSLFSVEDPEASVRLRELFNQLDTNQKALLSGKLEGLSGEELGGLFGITTHAIELRWAKLNPKLREILGVSRD